MAVERGVLTHLALFQGDNSSGNLRAPLDPTKSLLLTPSFGAIWYQNLDLGFPEIRASSQEIPDGNGSYDTTSLHGARGVSIDFTVLDDAFAGLESFIPGFDPAWNSAAYWVSVLGAWMSPERRDTRLYLGFKGQARKRWMDVRSAGMSPPISGEDGDQIEVQLNFVNPSGRMYGYDEGPSSTPDGRTRTVVRYGAAPIPGITFPLLFNPTLDFPARPPGTDEIISYGTVSTPFSAKLVSDASVATLNPRITVQHLDENGREDFPAQSIGLDGYTVAAGQHITIDTATETIFVGDDRSQRLGRYIGRGVFPVLRPGINRIDLSAATSPTPPGENFQAVITHSDAYLS